MISLPIPRSGIIMLVTPITNVSQDLQGRVRDGSRKNRQPLQFTTGGDSERSDKPASGLNDPSSGDSRSGEKPEPTVKSGKKKVVTILRHLAAIRHDLVAFFVATNHFT